MNKLEDDIRKFLDTRTESTMEIADVLEILAQNYRDLVIEEALKG